jgi:putative molybdopterin biosynthesis protein
MGIEMAARARGLDFVPLVHERYHLACLKSTLDQPATSAFVSCCRRQSGKTHLASHARLFTHALRRSAGHEHVLPWWRFQWSQA